MFTDIPLIQGGDRLWWRYQKLDDSTALLLSSLSPFETPHVCPVSPEDFDEYVRRDKARTCDAAKAADLLSRNDGASRPIVSPITDLDASAQLRRELGFPKPDELAELTLDAIGRNEPHLRMLTPRERDAVLSEHHRRQADAASEPHPCAPAFAPEPDAPRNVQTTPIDEAERGGDARGHVRPRLTTTPPGPAAGNPPGPQTNRGSAPATNQTEPQKTPIARAQIQDTSWLDQEDPAPARGATSPTRLS